jgi:DNA-3-methyladenine glycosylase
MFPESSKKVVVRDQSLGRSFFERPSDDVALALVGSLMTVRVEGGSLRILITETEAYGGDDDEASHAFRGPTARNAAMFGPAGHLYVYRIYGLHWCMNVVTGPPGRASAVLLRAGEVVSSRPATLATPDRPRYLRGPGNLTRALDVDRSDDGDDCCARAARVTFRIPSTSVSSFDVGRSTRIGITRARERPSRYFAVGHPSVARAPTGRVLLAKEPSDF